MHPDGNLYTADFHTNLVQKISPEGQITPVAGQKFQRGSTDGAGSLARFSGAGGIAVDLQGVLYVTDAENHTIRKLDSAGNVSTFAGVAGSKGSADGTLQTARFDFPTVIRFDPTSGRLYVGDKNGIRTIVNGAVNTTIQWTALRADICADPFGHSPVGLDVATDGRIAVSYGSCENVIGIYKDGQLQTRLGTKTAAYVRNDVDGPASSATLYSPLGMTFLDNGDLLIANQEHHNLKRYRTAAGLIERYAGQHYEMTGADGKGATARIADSICLHLDSQSNIWFWQGNDAPLKAWRKSDTAGNVISIAAPSDLSSACIAKINDDGSFIEVGYSNVTNGTAIRRRTSTGALVETLATISEPFGGLIQIVTSPTGDIYFTDGSGGIKKYTGGTVSTLVQLDQRNDLRGLAMLPSGDLLASTLNDGIWKVTPSGQASQLVQQGDWTKQGNGGAVDAAWIGYGPLAVDAKGAIYIANQIGSVIRRIANGRVDIVVGTYAVNETTLGPGPGSIYEVSDIKYDATTNSLVILTWNGLLRAALPD